MFARIRWVLPRAAGIGACGCAGTIACAAAYDNGFRRELQFWSIAGKAILHYKYTAWALSADTVDQIRSAEWNRLHELYAPEALATILKLRGLYIKFGQVCSVRPELVPAAYREQFKQLQHEVPASDFAGVQQTIEKELGAPLSNLFVEFDERPLGAASIGQAHRARVSHDGPEVAVKVQYPDARWQFTADLRCLETLVSMAAPESLPAFEEFSRQFMVELDYKAERGHIEEIHRTVMRRFSHVVAVPEVIPERCTDSVLTMTYLPGPTLDTEVRRQQAAAGLPADPVRAAGGIRAMLQQDGNHHHHLAGNDSSSDCQDTVHDSSGTALTGEPRNRSGWLLKLALGVVSVVGVDTGFAVLRQSRQLAAGCRWLFAQLVVFFLCPFKSNADLNLAQTSTEESRWIGWALAELQRQKAAEVVGQAENWLKTLFEVHGYCVLSPESSGLFNADPHPGNLIAMPDGRIGLIDFGQCKRVSQADRRLLADLLLAVKMRDEAGTAAAFRAAGMQTKNDSDFFLGRFGRLLFGKLEPQMMERSWHHELHKRDRIVQFPTDLLMVYRMATLLRGLGLSLRFNMSVAHEWEKFAMQQNQS